MGCPGRTVGCSVAFWVWFAAGCALVMSTGDGCARASMGVDFVVAAVERGVAGWGWTNACTI